jgi:hypothetical protein
MKKTYPQDNACQALQVEKIPILLSFYKKVFICKGCNYAAFLQKKLWRIAIQKIEPCTIRPLDGQLREMKTVLFPIGIRWSDFPSLKVSDLWQGDNEGNA